MRCAAILPCFNEARTIATLVGALRQRLPHVLVVDDGSDDGTASIARDRGAEVIRHGRNCGKGAAMQDGLARLLDSGFEWAATLDGDGQHDPAELPAFLECAEQTGARLVIGNRMPSMNAMPWLRRQVNRWMSRKLSNCAGRPLPDTQCGFRLIHLPTWATMSLGARHFEIESEMLMAFLATGRHIEFVPIRVIAGTRKSRIHPVRDSVRWWKWWRRMKRLNTCRSNWNSSFSLCHWCRNKL